MIPTIWILVVLGLMTNLYLFWIAGKSNDDIRAQIRIRPTQEPKKRHKF